MRKVSTHNLKHMINEEIDHIKNEIALINIIERKANAIISEDLGYERSNDLMVEFLDSFSKVPGYESASQTIKQNIALWLMERIAALEDFTIQSIPTLEIDRLVAAMETVPAPFTMFGPTLSRKKAKISS